MQTGIRRASEATEFLTSEGCWILEVANDERDPNVSISRARVPPGVTTEWHHLRGIEEGYLILAGQGRAEVGGLPATVVGPGDVVRIPANARQRITNTGGEDLVFWCVCTPRFIQDAYVAG